MRKLKNDELGRLTVDQFKEAEKTPLIVILDNVRSFNNVGSVFRTADAFLIEAVYLCGISACPPHREINKTALGATESVSWLYFKNTLDAVSALKAKGYQVLAVEQAENATMLDTFSPNENTPYAIVFGHEVNGVSQEVVNACDSCLEIPQLGTKHSLNISVSAGVVLWDFFNKLRKPNTNG